MSHNHATAVREQKSERRKYHASINFPFMVSIFSTLLHAINTIDDADYSINLILFIFIFQ